MKEPKEPIAICPYCHIASAMDILFSVMPRQHDRINLYTVAKCRNCDGINFGTVNSGTPNRQKVLYPIIRQEEPEEYPDEVRANYRESVIALRSSLPKASVIMTRSALQAAMRDKSARGNNLREEIDDLASKHIIPDSLKDWAHTIRNGGNLVAHPKPNEAVDEEDAEELILLAESVFLYLYVVPTQVEARRQRLQGTP